MKWRTRDARWRLGSMLLASAVALGAAGAALMPSPANASDNPIVVETSGAAPAGAAAAASDGVAALMAKAEAAGGVPVIATLAVPVEAPHTLSEAAAAAQSATLSATQARVLSRLGVSGTASTASTADGVSNVKLYEYSPLLAVTVDAARLSALLNDPDVVRVTEDVAVPPALKDTIPLIGASGPHAQGWDGTGWVVAVLDTGVNKNHVFLSGKVVSEACYSTTNAQSTSLCPGGNNSTASGSGIDCQNASGCGHGTHVAGIATGKTMSLSGSNIEGVADDAGVLAIQIFSRFTGGCTTSPCVRTWNSDQILGLERVYALRNTYKIASVNMSLGGGQFFAACDSDSRKPIIDSLLSAGIATAIASGNDGFNGSVGAPGCISSAVTVGSTDKNNNVSSFSNHANMVDIMAPGGSIQSSYGQAAAVGTTLCNNCFAFLSGTSMATPHVAGTFALLRECKGAGPTVAQLLSALQSTGVGVTRNGITKPRIKIDSAITALGGCSGGLPPAATLISPTGTIADNTPTYRWNAVSSATWYYLWVNQGSTNKIQQWYTAAQAGCSSGSGQCAVTPTTALANAAHSWWIRTYNSSGYGPWSSGLTFTVNTNAPPPAPTPIAPKGPVQVNSGGDIAYSWTGSSSATWYRLWINRGGTNIHQTWYTAAQTSCGGSDTSCTVTPNINYTETAHTWWVQGWRSGPGAGAWSPGTSFYPIVNAPSVGPVLSAPSGTITDTTPTYVWGAVPDATWYYLYVDDSSSGSPKFTQWFTATSAGCASGAGNCSATPATALANGAATAWVRGWNGFGNGPWGPGKSFTVNGATACVFNNQFSSASDLSEWNPTVGTWSHSSSAYYYTAGVDGLYATTVRKNKCADVDLTARLWRYSDSSTAQAFYGVWLRASSTVASDGIPSDGYWFGLDRNAGNCGVYKRQSGGWVTPPAPWFSCSALVKGSAWNIIRAIAKGSSLALYVNSTKVWGGTDSDLTDGYPGIFSYNSSGTTGNGFYVDYATGSNPPGTFSVPNDPSAGTSVPGKPFNGDPALVTIN